MAKNKNNAPAENEEAPEVTGNEVDTPEATEPEEKEHEVKKPEAKKEVKGFAFRFTTKTSFKSTIVIEGEAYEMVCKDGVIRTSSVAVANHLRKRYQEMS